MKSLIFKTLICSIVFLSCKKETEVKTVEKEVIKTNTEYKSCKVLITKGYDVNSGVENSRVLRYYSNTGKLDSIVGFNPTRYYVTKYEYLSNSERKSILYDLINNTSNGYTIEKLNSDGEPIETKVYNKDNQMTMWYSTEYRCN